jgi:hypothetical protein
MADKTITFFEPVSADVKNINLEYEGGTILRVHVRFVIRTNDPEDPEKTRHITIDGSDLGAQAQTNLNNLATAVLTRIRNTFGFV